MAGSSIFNMTSSSSVDSHKRIIVIIIISHCNMRGVVCWCVGAASHQSLLIDCWNFRETHHCLRLTVSPVVVVVGWWWYGRMMLVWWDGGGMVGWWWACGGCVWWGGWGWWVGVVW